MAQNIVSFCSTISRLGVRVCHGLLAVLLLALVTATTVQAQTPPPVFSKAFSPSTIGPGSVSTLVFTIDNTASSAGARSLDFTDNLPPGVTIASPAATSTTCTGGIITAPDGGSTIAYSGGGVGGGRTCVVRVNVTSSTVGKHTNVSGDLTSDAGNSGPATADLFVATDRPGFTKAFSPSTVVYNGRSTLTFTIDNSANASALTTLNFTDTMPTGMVVASPANASTTCGTTTFPPTLTATPGTGVVSLSYFGTASFPAVAAGATCTVKVDVIGGAVGPLGNTSGELSATVGTTTVSSGKAGAVLTVSALATNIFLDKTFTNDPVAPGGTVNLRFTIFNRDRDFPAASIAFSDDLDAVVPGLVATGLPISACGGTLDSSDGGSTIDFTDGSLALGASCTINVTVEVPAGAAPDTYTNTTTNITADLGGDTVVGNAATDKLFIEPRPALTKTFLDDPVGSGGTTTLEFTITNTSPTSSATDIAFEDVFNEVLQTASLVPSDGSCGTGSDFTFTPLINSGTGSTLARLVLSGGELAAGESCTFSITLDVSPSAATATYTNTTSAITAVIDGETYTGDPASDDLVVVAAPRLTKLFTDDPVAPGGTVTLEFTLTHDENAPGDATNIAFTDDLAAMTAGLEATGLPASVCGGTLSGTTNLSFTGGTLAPGESCTFSVSIDVDATAVSGVYNNLTSDVTATVLGVTASETPAEDELVISALTLTKEFTDDPVAPGGTVTLKFTLTNDDPTNEATSIAFTDNLEAVLEDLGATGGVPASVCGGNLIGATGNSLLLFTGGIVPAGESCSFSVTLEVPSDAFEDDYPNLTSEVTALLGGEEIKSPPAVDVLTVGVPVNELTLSKAFTNDPVSGGATVNLRFRVSFLGSENATGIAFTDDLSAVLPGLVATGLPASVCGGTLSGTGTLAFTGGSLAPGESCTFNVTLQVPVGTADGFYPNTTSTITGTVDTETVTGAAATDVLRIVNRLLLPVADAGEDQTVECAYADGAGTPVTLDGSASNDPDGGPLTYSWTRPGEEGEEEFSTEVSPTLILPIGTYTFTLTVVDDEGDTASDAVVITVQDTLPPTITTAEGPIELWPPNHNYYSFAVSDFVTAVSDVCDPGLSVADVTLTSVSSDEPEDATGGGDGNTLDDIVIAGGCQAVDLRSERQGSGNGRVYTSNLEVTDASGNAGYDTFQVIVPKSKNKGAVDDGPVYVVNGECDDLFTDERKIGRLRLATFNARVDAQQTVLLDWKAAPGTVADGPLEVEYRPAEIEDFRLIGQGTDRFTHGGASLAPGTHYYRLRQTDAEGRILHSDEVEVFIELPGDFALSAVYPNPFNPEARFTLMVKAEEQVQIKVFSILGRHVATLHSGTLNPQQNHTFVLDGSDLPSGTYLIRAIGETFTATRQVVLLK